MGSVFSGAIGAQNMANAQNPYSGQQFSNVLNNQNSLEQALLMQAQGQGVNPAQQQYLQNAQNIQQNQANQYAANRALNPGLAARMAGNTGANLTQQAASTAGIQQAQQQLAAQGQLGQLTLGQQQLMNQANLGAAQINAGVSGQNAQTNAGLVGGLINAGGGVGAAVARGGHAYGGYIGDAMKQGGVVPGHAPYPGDTLKNDNIHTMLSPGEIVIPRTASQSPDKAKDFIDALMSNKQKDDDTSGSYLSVIAAKKKAAKFSNSQKKKS